MVKKNKKNKYISEYINSTGENSKKNPLSVSIAKLNIFNINPDKSNSNRTSLTTLIPALITFAGILIAAVIGTFNIMISNDLAKSHTEFRVFWYYQYANIDNVKEKIETEGKNKFNKDSAVTKYVQGISEAVDKALRNREDVWIGYIYINLDGINSQNVVDNVLIDYYQPFSSTTEHDKPIELKSVSTKDPVIIIPMTITKELPYKTNTSIGVIKENILPISCNPIDIKFADYGKFLFRKNVIQKIYPCSENVAFNPNTLSFGQ